MKTSSIVLLVAAVHFASLASSVAQTASFVGATIDSAGGGGFNGLQGVCFSPITNEGYLAEYGNGTIHRFHSSGLVTSGHNALATNPVGIAFPPDASKLFLTAASDETAREVEFVPFSIPFGPTTIIPSLKHTWGGVGTTAGKFNNPFGIAVDPATGDLLVCDNLNHRVQRFDAGRNYLGEWGSQGTLPGQFDQPFGIAVHPTSGQIYVTDLGNDRVQRFASNGAFELSWGSSGTGPAQFDEPYFIAVDESGHVYVTDNRNNRAQVFTSSGRYLFTFGELGSGLGEMSSPRGIAVGGSLAFVADGSNRLMRYVIGDEAPVATVTGGLRNRVVRRPSFTLTGTASDDLAVDKVEVQVGSAGFKQAAGSQRWNFRIKRLGRGTTTLNVRATDLGGKISRISTLRVRLRKS